MKHIPDTHNALVLRTDFSDTAAWEAICAAIRKPVGAFKAYVDFVSDPAYDGISTEQLRSLIPQGSNHTFMFIVDRIALLPPDYPILVVDLYTQLVNKSRATHAYTLTLHNTLSI